MQIETRRFLTWSLVLAVLTALAYWPGMSGGFLFDDYPNIVKQERVHVTSLTLDSLAKAWSAFSIGPFGRPLAMVTFAVDHYFWGLDPRGFKLTSLAVHVLNTLLVFVLVSRLLRLRSDDRTARLMPAAIVATLWAIHPLQVSTVLYVVQRMETLSLTFVLLALVCYLHGRKRQIRGQRGWPWLAACVPLVCMGLLSKETAALFPAFTLALELTVLRFESGSDRTTRFLKGSYLLACTAAVGVFVFFIVPEYAADNAYALRSFTLGERLLTQMRVLPTYLFWILVPQPASYIFYFDTYPTSSGLLSPVTTLLGGLSMAALAAVAIALRRRLPLFSLGIAWFFAAHLLTSNVIALEMVFEHRNYFAILGVLLAIYGLVSALPPSEIPRVRNFAASVLVIGFFTLTLIRSAGWGNPMQLALELSQRNPDSTRASTDLGEQYMLRAGRDPSSRYYAMAEAEFERGSRVPGASPLPEQGLIILALTAKQTDKAEWWDRLIRKLEERTVGPQEVSMITEFLAKRERGLPLNDQKLSEAYMVVVKKVGMPASQYYAIGLHAMRHLGDERLAGILFAIAVNKSLDNPAFIVGMVETLHKNGHENNAQMLADHAWDVAKIRITLPSPPDARIEAAASPDSGLAPARE